MSTRSAPARRAVAASTPPLTCGELAASVFGPSGTADAHRRAAPVRTAAARPRPERRRPADLAPSVLRLVVLLGVGSVVTVIALAALFATILLITG